MVDAISFVGMAAASTGVLYTLSAAFGSFAAGFPPAVQALSLDIYTNRRPENRGEVGKLLGALNVIQALAYVFPFPYSRPRDPLTDAVIYLTSCDLAYYT